ncbi:MAG: hypothetical protein IPG45_01200 [Deltaproteobacteria bacterium]|nr:hypothetical protein [Deltaproteobacteria bacterium]
MDPGLLGLAIATLTSSVGDHSLLRAEQAVAACRFTGSIPKVGRGGALEPWTVEAVELEGQSHFEILVRVAARGSDGAKEEWRRWLFDPQACRLVGLISRRTKSGQESGSLYAPLASPPTELERRQLLSRAGYRPCEAGAPPVPEFPAGALPNPTPETAPGTVVLGPVTPITWHRGRHADPRLCWSKGEPLPRPKKVAADSLVPTGPSFRLVDLGGSAEACRLMGASCDGQPLSVDGRRVQVLSLDARGAAMVLVEELGPRRWAAPVSDPRGLKLLGRYEDLLWVSVPGPGGLGFSLVAVDLAAGQVRRLGFAPVDDWMIAKSAPTGLWIRDVDYPDALGNAETWQDRQAVDERFPISERPWKKLAEAVGR